MVASVAAASVAVHKQKDESDDDKPYDRIVKQITETVHLNYLSFLVGKPDLLIISERCRSSLLSYEKRKDW